MFIYTVEDVIAALVVGLIVIAGIASVIKEAVRDRRRRKLNEGR